MFLQILLSWLRPTDQRRSARPRPAARLQVERLEDRLTPSGGYLLVGDYDTHSVLRYDADTGAFVDTFVPKHSGGLHQPQGMVFSPDGQNLYVAGGELSISDQHQSVLRYDGHTGAFQGTVVDGDQLGRPHAVIFGPDGNLYVAMGYGTDSRVARFDAHTGAFLGDFVPANSPGQLAPYALVFGPSGTAGKLDLYVTSGGNDSVLRYDGTTGAPLGAFVAPGSGGLDNPIGLTFGPDGNLYVANAYASTPSAIYRFQGPIGDSPGAPLPSPGNSGAVFVASGSGGLLSMYGLIFGPDGNGDGRQDLYLPSFQTAGYQKAKEKAATIKRFDGTTGAFIDTFVTANSGGLDQPNYLIFTETDPVTLAYIGTGTAAVAPLPSARGTVAATTGTKVNGGGRALLADSTGASFPLTFALEPMFRNDGSAYGNINFVFGASFGQSWGTAPGVTSVHLTGAISSMTVAEDGAVSLLGLLTEKDYARGGGVVFIEDNVPFKILLSPGSSQFTLQWCELPTFQLGFTNGHLDVQ